MDSTQAGDTQPAAADTLRPLLAPGLAPLFWRAERLGTSSAWWQHVPFAHWLVAEGRPRLLVELGSHGGVSYAAFCNAVRRTGLDTRCFAVDTWQGDEHAGHYDETVFADLSRYHDAAFSDFSQMLRCTFDTARERFAPGSIDLLHIDGLHTYDAVRHDFESWLPLLSDRAVVLFHDTTERQADFGVWRLWAELAQRYPAFEFAHGHGLGVLCVGADAPEAVRTLCALPEAEAAVLRQRMALLGARWDEDSLRLQAGTELGWLRAQMTHLAGAHEKAARLDRETAEQKAALTRARAEAARLAEGIRGARAAVREARARSEAEARQAVEAANQQTAAAHERVAFLATAIAALEREVHIFKASSQNEHEGRQRAEAALAQARTEAGTRVAEAQRETQAAFQARDLVLASTAWRATAPLRHAAALLPRPIRWHGRRAMKALWWAATPWNTGRRREILRLRALPELSGSIAHHPSPAPVPAVPPPAPAVETPALSFIAPSPEPAPVSSPEPAARADPDRLDQVGPPTGNPEAASLWYDQVAPQVSIVVLNWNRGAMTLRCLQHLWANTTGHRYEIIVVDNGSRPEELRRLRGSVPLARIVTLGVNRYFGEANNIGAEDARGELVCFLNNDAFVHEGWLERLVQGLETLPQAGAVGPRFLYPDGTLQEAGATVSPDAHARQLGKHAAGDDAAFASVQVVDYVSAACVLMRRASFMAVLGFDLMWDPAYYEDVDLCLKLRLLGLRTYVVPEAVVTHVENATSADASHGLRLERTVGLNQQKFRQRWRAALQGVAPLPGDLLPRPASPVAPAAGQPHVLLFTPYALTPGGGERFLLAIAEALRGQARVTLVTPGRYSHLRLLTVGRELGLDLSALGWMSLEQARADRADVAFVVGNEIYPPVEGLARQNVHILQFPFPNDDAYLSQVRGFTADYGLVLCYSPFVQRVIEGQARALRMPDVPIEVLTPPVPLYPASSAKLARILHVGRFFTGGHAKRQDLLIDAFERLVQEDGLQAELHLAGSVQPEPEHRDYYLGLVQRAQGLPVHFHANCGPDELAGLYETSRVYWHATGFGEDVAAYPEKTEHFGISVIEAMSAACVPVVFAAGGPAETVRHGETGFLFATADELRAHTMALMTPDGAPLAARMGQAAAAAAQAYGPEVFAGRVRDLVARLIAESATL